MSFGTCNFSEKWKIHEAHYMYIINLIMKLFTDIYIKLIWLVLEALGTDHSAYMVLLAYLGKIYTGFSLYLIRSHEWRLQTIHKLY